MIDPKEWGWMEVDDDDSGEDVTYYFQGDDYDE